MISSSQKRRNYSKDLTYESKLYPGRNTSSNLLLSSYNAMGLFKQRNYNRSLASSDPEDSTLKKKGNAPYRANQQLSTLDHRISNFSSKIRTLLKGEEEQDDKENVGVYQTITTNYFEKSRSAIFKRAELNLKDFVDQPLPSPPYFVECLKRKSIVSTETCMHIHNSILTFKQYQRAVQFSKSRSPDKNILPEVENRKTIVFDMDETLIHTNETMSKGYEIKVPFKSVQGKVVSGYVSVRPYAKQIIKNMSRYCDVIVFTAGNQCYADPILDYLDPEGCIKHRLYRDSCTMVNNQMFVKDLRILGRRLESVVLVDNAPHSYMMQLANGVPILNYLKGKEDDQLVKLQGYLMGLLDVADVRVVNTQTFRLAEYHRYENYSRLIQELYGRWL